MKHKLLMLGRNSALLILLLFSYFNSFSKCDNTPKGEQTYEKVYDIENSGYDYCPISSISMEPTSYLEKNDPETGRTVKEVWNADQPIDFLQAFDIKDQDGNLLSVVDKAKVKWYVEDRSKTDDKFIYVNPNDPYNVPTEYYFNSVPNVDQWGEVLIRAEYECADGAIIHTVAELDILDIGIYFRDPSGDILRWHKNLYEKDPSIYDGFYNPSKNIVLHSHGWQPGANARHELNPSGNPERGKLDSSGILDWYSDYNVLLFFWTQSAEHLNGEILNTVERPSERIVYNNPAWVREDGTESRAGIGIDPVGVMCGKHLEEIINASGFNNATNEVRLAGHSLGSIMVTRAALFLGNSVVDRVAYLDPAMTVTFMNLYNDQISANPSVMPPIEWYQTSPYDYFAWHPLNWLLMQSIDKDTYNEMILNATYVRIHPLWQNSYAEWDTLIGRCLLSLGNCKEEVLESLYRSYPIGDGALHGNAKQHYYSSLKDTKPLVVESVEPDLAVMSILNCPKGSIGAESREDILFHAPPFYSNPLYNKCFETTGLSNGPSAAASIEDLNKYRGIPLEQVYGVNTVTTADDHYTQRNTGANRQLHGQDYDQIETSHTNEEVGSSIYGKEATTTLSASESSRGSISLEDPIRPYPNPTKNKLYLDVGDQKIKQLFIVDLNGRVLLEQDINNKTPEIDVSNIVNGIYILKVVTSKNVERNFTFIKSKQ